MIDKVQKIKDWISKEQEGLMDAKGNFEYPEHEGAYHILCNLDAYIDSLQEEPSKFDAAVQEGDDVRNNEDLGCRVNLSQLKRVAKKDSRYCMYSKDNFTDEDRKVLCNGCEETCEFNKKEEPVSEELEEASKEWLRPQLDKSYVNYGEAKMMELTHFDGYAMLNAIEFGAEWQKAKDESTTENLGEYINELSKQFPEVSFAKLSRIAVRVAKWKKQQIKRAMDLGEPPYLISVEQAYYRTLKLLEE